MKKELRDYLSNYALINYRLRDGSSVIANEKHYDKDTQSFYISGAVEIKLTPEGSSFLIPWVLTDDEDIIQIQKSNIITSAAVSEDIQIQYHKYLIKLNLQDNLTEKEIGIILDQVFTDDVDNLDTSEVDGGYEALYDYDEPKDLEWRSKWKPYNN